MTPEEILKGIQQRAAATLNASVVTDPVIRERVDYVCRCMSNRAGVRLLMSCLLGKLDKPNVDPRKPYTFIIQSVTVPTFELPASIQKQVNAKAGYQAELQTIAAEQAVIEQRKQLQQVQAIVAANALEQASKATGLTPEQIIAWQKARALSAMAEKMGSAQALVQVKP